MPGSVTIFITTPRSGTQWVADTVGKAYGELAVVQHEPIKYAYRPREFIRAYDRVEEEQRLPAVAAHLEEIAAIDDSLAYVEVGFPAVASVPLYYSLYGDRLRVVQLIRNPMETAASMATVLLYDAARSDSMNDDIAIEPTDPGAFQKHYADRWPDLSTYEKCLFYWTEVHLHGLEIEAGYHDTPFLRTRFEDLIATPDEHLRQLVEFIGLPHRPEIAGRTGDRVDQYRRVSYRGIDWGKTAGHAMTVGLAEAFGYDVGKVDRGSLNSRYVSRYRMARGFLRRSAMHARSFLPF